MLSSNLFQIYRKKYLLTAAGILSVIVFSSELVRASNDQSFVAQYVEAINSKNTGLMKDLMAPGSRACVNKENEKYFDELFISDFKYTIPEKYTAKLEPLTTEKLDNAKQRILLAQRLDLPVEQLPTHYLQIQFESGQNHFIGIDKYLVFTNDKYGLDYACPTGAWLADYWKRKHDPKEQEKYAQRLTQALEESQRSIPLSQRKSFFPEEYGALFYKSELFPLIWKFKTKAKFRKLEVVLVGPHTEEKILTGHHLPGVYVPVQFEFYIGDVEKIRNGLKDVLRVGVGFGRTGGFQKSEDHPYSESSSVDLEGEVSEVTFINKIVSSKDILKVSSNIPLATITTQTGSQKFSYNIILRAETKGSYLLTYEYKFTEGKNNSYLSNGQQQFSTYTEVKNWATKLPVGTSLIFNPGCKRWGNEMLSSEKEIEDFKQFCSAHGLILDIRPSG